MKKTNNIWVKLAGYSIRPWILALGIAFLFSISLTAQTANAFHDTFSNASSNAMAYLAEQKINERNEAMNAQKEKIETDKDVKVKDEAKDNNVEQLKNCGITMLNETTDC